MVQVDLLRYLHILWVDINQGNLRLAVKFIEEFAQMLEMADLGYHSEIDAGVERATNTARDMRTLNDESEFDEELRRLLGDDK